MEPAALIGVSVTLLGALIATVWKFSAIATALELGMKELREDQELTREAIGALREIPTLATRVGMVEGAVTKLASEFPRMKERITVLEHRAGSTDRFRAVTESQLDREEITRREGAKK